MSGYVIAVIFSSSSPEVAVKATTKWIRIVNFNGVYNSSGINLGADYYRVSSATLTGGTTYTPVPFRDTAPAPTASIKSGSTVSGTQTLFQSSALVLSKDFDFLIAPGDAVRMVKAAAGSPTYTSSAFSLTYEELALARST